MKIITILTLFLLTLTTTAFAQQYLLNENFDASNGLPAGWASEGTYIAETYGVSGSNAVFANIQEWYPVMFLRTPQVGPISAGTRFEFAYRVSSNYEMTGQPIGSSTITVKINNQTIHTIDSNNHTTSSDFTIATVSLDSYVGQSIQIQIVMSVGNPPNNRDIHLDDVKVYVTTSEHDLAAQSLSGLSITNFNTPTTYTVRVINFGSTEATDYTVKLYQENTPQPLELTTANGVAIPPDEHRDIALQWTPTVAGNVQIYGYVDFPSDDDNDNNQTQSLSVEVLPANVEMVYIGDPATTATHTNPVFAYTHHSSINQTVYLASEVGRYGVITSLTYRFTGAGDIAPDTPIRLYMATSDIDGYPAADSWVPTADFTLVYDGSLPVGESGSYDVRIVLDTPFTYDSQNLVIMAHRPLDTETYSTSNRWQTTARTDHYRTLAFERNDTPISISDMPGGYPLLFIPNIRIDFTTGGFGSLSGVVTANSTPIPNALVKINGTNRYTITDELGGYTFQNIFTGNITISATKHGFFDYQSESLSITEDENTTYNLSMIPLPTVAVNGYVQTNDTNSPLPDCTVTLTGYENYTITTNENGQFTFPTVYANMTYTLTIYKNNFQRYTDAEIVVGAVNLTIPTITLFENTHQPRYVMASTTDTHAILYWQAPPTGSELSFTHATSETMFNALGTDSPVEFEVAHRYSSAHLQSLGVAGAYLSKVAFVPNFDALYMIKIYGGCYDTHLQPLYLIYEQIVTQPLTLGIYNEVELYEINPIPDTDDLWIGYFVATDGGYPAAYDSGPAVSGYGNLMKYGGVWATMTDIAGYDYNWMIKGTAISTVRRDTIYGVRTIPYRSVTAYKIYRTTLDNIDNESQWSLIENYTTETEYADPSWETAPDGGYRYAVKAVYTGDRLSPPAFSNIITKNITSLVGITLNYPENTPDSEHTVMLVNHDGNPTHVYGSVCACLAVHFPDVWYGQYTLTVTKTGFVTYEDVVNINESTFTCTVNLEPTNILLSESFEGVIFPPPGWSLLDADEDGHNFRRRSISENVAAQDGNWSAISESWVGNNTADGVILHPDNYLILPPIAIYEGVDTYFRYFVAIQDDENPIETYSIVVSRSTPIADSFIPVFTETLSASNAEYQQRQINLTDFAGQTIYIGFRHHDSTDNYQIKFDSVTLYYEGDPFSDTDITVKPPVSRLLGNYPNPFNPSTTISFDMSTEGQVNISVYNIKGQRVRTLANDVYGAGRHSVVWAGDDFAGLSVGSGVYFYRMRVEGYTSVRKMLLLK